MTARGGQVGRGDRPVRLVQHAELQAARARVDDQHAHGLRLPPARSGTSGVRPARLGRRTLSTARSSPDPGHVVALHPRVRPGLEPAVGHQLAHVPGARRQARHPVDHVHDQVEAVHVVEHHHVERRGGGALFLVAPHVDVRWFVRR